jgi:hypothetical protein
VRLGGGGPGARRGGATASDGRPGRRVKKQGRGGRALEGRRKGEGGADVWGHCARGREMERDALGLRTGRAGPGVAHAGRERKRGEGEGEGEGGGLREKRVRPKRKKGGRPS